MVDFTRPPFITYLLCGPFEFSIAPKDFSFTAQPLVTLGGANGLTLTLQPDNTYAPGIYEMYLIGTLTDFPARFEQQIFTVEVLPCAAESISFDAFEASISNIENVWYAAPTTKDFTGFESLITVTPDCGDNYLFELFYNPPNTSTLSPVLPGELSFTNQVLSLQKCHPQGAASADAECSLEPRRKEFDLVIRISLLDDKYANPATRTFKEFVFKAIVTNVCFDDALSFSYEESIINYVLSTSAPIVPYQPVLASTYPLCRSQCNLFEVGKPGYPVAVVSSFN